MSNSYRELMEQVEVTAEMRTRILENLDRVEAAPRRKSVPFRYGLLAACVAILVTVGLSEMRRQPEGGLPEHSGVIVSSPFTAADSVEDLERIVGFHVPELTGLPFAREQVSYRAVGANLAEVVYTGEGQTAVFRKSLGSEDNSGDYNPYACVTDVSLEGSTGQLKGDGACYTLACWYTGEAAYSLHLSEGLSQADWLDLMASLTE